MGAIVRKTKIYSTAVALLITLPLVYLGSEVVQKLDCMGLVKFHLVGREKETVEMKVS